MKMRLKLLALCLVIGVVEVSLSLKFSHEPLPSLDDQLFSHQRQTHGQQLSRRKWRTQRRVLFVCNGFYTSIRPLTLIAEQLSLRGFDVVFATHDEGKRWLSDTKLKVGCSFSCRHTVCADWFMLQFESLGSTLIEDERLHNIYDRMAVGGLSFCI